MGKYDLICMRTSSVEGGQEKGNVTQRYTGYPPVNGCIFFDAAQHDTEGNSNAPLWQLRTNPVLVPELKGELSRPCYSWAYGGSKGV